MAMNCADQTSDLSDMDWMLDHPLSIHRFAPQDSTLEQYYGFRRSNQCYGFKRVSLSAHYVSSKCWKTANQITSWQLVPNNFRIFQLKMTVSLIPKCLDFSNFLVRRRFRRWGNASLIDTDHVELSRTRRISATLTLHDCFTYTDVYYYSEKCISCWAKTSNVALSTEQGSHTS